MSGLVHGVFDVLFVVLLFETQSRRIFTVLIAFPIDDGDELDARACGTFKKDMLQGQPAYFNSKLITHLYSLGSTARREKSVPVLQKLDLYCLLPTLRREPNE